MKKFDEFINENSGKRTVKLKNKNNASLIITFDVIGGIIKNITKDDNIRFPYKEGQPYNRGMETWCCNNNYYMDGKDTCPEKKVFGMRTKDIPQGHELRYLFPNKFKK
jgi:hypothetical protein